MKCRHFEKYGNADLSENVSFTNSEDKHKAYHICNNRVIFDYGKFFEPNSKRKTKIAYQDYIYNNDGFDVGEVGKIFFYTKEEGDRKMRELGLLGMNEGSVLSIGM